MPTCTFHPPKPHPTNHCPSLASLCTPIKSKHVDCKFHVSLSFSHQNFSFLSAPLLSVLLPSRPTLPPTPPQPLHLDLTNFLVIKQSPLPPDLTKTKTSSKSNNFNIRKHTDSSSSRFFYNSCFYRPTHFFITISRPILITISLQLLLLSSNAAQVAVTGVVLVLVLVVKRSFSENNLLSFIHLKYPLFELGFEVVIMAAIMVAGVVIVSLNNAIERWWLFFTWPM